MRTQRFLLAMCWSAASPVMAQTALTLYNQQFAVVRETLPLALERGENRVRFSQVTAYLEPETVIVRDPSGKVALRVLEQNYLADPLSIDSMLSRHEGQTIQFLTREGEETRIVEGKIIRAGRAGSPVAPNSARFAGPYGVQYGQALRAPAQTIVEVDGRTRFQLPGIPLFPPLAADALLKPAIEWVIESPAAAQLDAEVAYISGGLNWNADYNVVSPLDGDALELIGWVTMRNDSGKSFEKAQVKLMSGDVSKLDPRRVQVAAAGGVIGGVAGGAPGPPQVTERTFDEYHLYSLERAMNLRDGETKQVEFLRASGIKAKLIYVYEGAKFDPRPGYGPPEMILQDSSYGTKSNPKVWVMREFVNSTANKLGMPLPQGRIRFYRRDADGRLEFTGEDELRHTPRDETVRVFTGAAFDLVGERKRTNFYVDHGRRTVEESFEIRLRNRKQEAVEVLVSERLYRAATWDIYSSSTPFEKKDSQQVEFRASLAPNEEKAVSYSVRYTW